MSESLTLQDVSAASAAETLSDEAGENMTNEQSELASFESELATLETLLLARSYFYQLFHKLFGGTPNAELIDALLSDATVDVVDEYAEENESMKGLKQFLYDLRESKNREQLLDQAKDEYTRLFVGPAALPAPTWESPYRTKEMTLFQENTLVVREIYRSQGLRPKHYMKVADDHVALLCDFMAKQARLSLQAFREAKLDTLSHDLRSQQVFVAEHLSNWLGDFAKRTRSSQTAVLYPQMIEALAAFFEIDVVFLIEASFWAETTQAEIQPGNQLEYQPEAQLGPQSEIQSTELSAAKAPFDKIENALQMLDGISPFGIEEYELTSVML